MEETMEEAMKAVRCCYCKQRVFGEGLIDSPSNHGLQLMKLPRCESCSHGVEIE